MLANLIRRIISLRAQQGYQLTLLAACPNSATVLEAAVSVAARNHMPMLFAATLNQVDRDGGYTGWTPATFVAEMNRHAARYQTDVPLYPCLDHGGPWLKDLHTINRLSLAETMHEVRLSLTACIEAGYSLLHIDPTVDRTLPPNTPMPIALVVERTIDLIEHAEEERRRLGIAPISYEVGTEEVHGGLVDMENFRTFLHGLHTGLADRGLLEAWPCFVVGKVGTDLHTSYFDPESARLLYDQVQPRGSLIKGHYSDWVENPQDYPVSGMGGANVGPEFTAAEYRALLELDARAADMARGRPAMLRSRLPQALEDAVYASNRWRKWLQPGEEETPFALLAPERKNFLIETGCRYVWTQPDVVAERDALYESLFPVLADPHGWVVEQIARQMERYITPFHLFDSATLLQDDVA